MTSSLSRSSGTSAPGPGAAKIAPPTAKAPPRARVTRRGATATTRGAAAGMTGTTRRRSQLRVAPAAPSTAPGSVNSPGSSPWATGVGGGLLRRIEGGRRRPRSRSTGRLRQLADAPVPRVPDAPPDAAITLALGDDRRGLLFGPASSSCRGLDLLGRPEWRGWGRGRGWRQGRCLIFQLCLRRLRLLQPPETPGRSPRIFSWCLLPPVARLGAPFALFAYLPYLLRRETRKGLRAPYLFSACKPSGLSCV